eukprot:maker-scaffold70_size417918-snap-gene-2.11 protein:Tk01875 transcript:maker-scaffold70_size417918-snap-gene-2.11-mRNA-1 annotation:"sac3 domain-containing protein 1-like isoform x1"
MFHGGAAALRHHQSARIQTLGMDWIPSWGEEMETDGQLLGCNQQVKQPLRRMSDETRELTMAGSHRVVYDPLMCPDRERKWRMEAEMIHRLERVQGGLQMVKRFARSAAGDVQNDPKILRSPQICLRTTQYLIQELLLDERAGLDRTRYHFIFDRLRAIRQDLVIQRIRGPIRRAILEISIRFHLIASHELCQLPPGDYDHHLNLTHTLQCLQDLMSIHEEQAMEAGERDEMTSTFILISLGSSDVMHWAFARPASLRQQPRVARALRIVLKFTEGNFVGVFKLMRSLPLLQQLALFNKWNLIVKNALHVMTASFGIKNCQYPVQHLCQLVNLNHSHESGVINFVSIIQKLGIDVDNGKHIRFAKRQFKPETNIPLMKLPFIAEQLDSLDWKKFILGQL